jgi:hypothetical protein
MPDESALGERVTLFTIFLPPKDQNKPNCLLSGVTKPDGFVVHPAP